MAFWGPYMRFKVACLEIKFNFVKIGAPSRFQEGVHMWHFKFTNGFYQGYLHDNKALLLFCFDNMQIKKEVLSFFYYNNLKAKEEWTIMNSLHLTHHVHNSKGQ